jgi:hypothetical protein
MKTENTIYEIMIKSARQVRVVGSYNGKTDRLLDNANQAAK